MDAIPKPDELPELRGLWLQGMQPKPDKTSLPADTSSRERPGGARSKRQIEAGKSQIAAEKGATRQSLITAEEEKNEGLAAFES